MMVVLTAVLLGGFYLMLTPPGLSAQESAGGSASLAAPSGNVASRGNEAALSGIKSTYRISVPFGFNTPLPILNGGNEVLASGHGGCTAGEEVTVGITVTQPISVSGAVATGEKVWTCNGETQMWQMTATAVTTTTVLVDGPAEACGLATTRADGSVTDTFDWCRDVDLVTVNPQNYLPIVLNTNE
ncbi:MAG: hypothetical protein KC441_20350 [Anaerolineales bacterium]|nr:hypothetical protein [Anaerolineales bacterium]